ncbi:serine/threonine-protein phosphatase 6 regulatory ankyrin repeat subunit C-like [Harmonia axyridis]|uniref:serine/threonine-protein phosphatase 6 regulatory ankyrin repeat subunit C-like n=1 Tax=Harmonia axyridis TaxID=115357 RepID=UPI001E275BEC|nr:serine/threonine-protein phosphatase 6 regulatory ankyrin repeat subunit C-like [Harmonia axyridis]
MLKGHNPHTPNIKGMTPIHLAVKNSNFEALDVMIMYGGDINIRDAHDRTPIFYISRIGDLPRVMYHGPMLNVVDIDGNSLLQYLIEHTAKVKRLNKRLLPLHRLIYKGINVGTINKYGDNLLHTLAKHTTDIYYFVEHKHDIAKTLLELGVDVNQKNMLGETPLHICVMYDCQYTRLFLKHGGDMNLKNKDEVTPLDIAISRRNSRCFCFDVMVRYLVHRVHQRLPCNNSNFKLIRKVDERIFINYQLSAYNLKTKRIIKTDPRTYYNILTGTKLEIRSIINNPKMRNALCVSDLEFSEELDEKLKDELHNEHSEKVIEILTEVLWDVLPYLCIKQIVLFMTERDINKLLLEYFCRKC